MGLVEEGVVHGDGRTRGRGEENKGRSCLKWKRRWSEEGRES